MSTELSKVSFYRVYRVIEVLLGIVFFVSGYSKLIEINKFAVQIYSYGVIEYKPVLPWIALGVILVELVLAVLLTFGISHKRFLHLFVLLLLLSFSGLIIYGWIFHNLKDCGCFGKIEMGPGTSLVKNIVLIIFTSFCLITGKNIIYQFQKNSFSSKYKYLVLLIVLLSGFFMGYSKLKSETHLFSSTVDSAPLDSLVKMNFEVDGKLYDLSKGEYLVALLSFGCDHCIEEAPKLNEYLLMQDIPSLVGICLEESAEEKEEFIRKVNPSFPVYSLGNKPILFLSMIDREPPRLVHIRDGKVLKIWDYNLPEVDELVKYFDFQKH